MADETVVEETIEDTEVQEEQVGIPETKTKTFTEKQVNDIVKNRLAKEKNSFKLEKDSLVSEKTSLQETIDKYEAKFGGLIEAQLAEIPAPFKKLLDGMSLLEKMEWLEENKDENLSGIKHEIPQTPKGNGSNSKGGKNHIEFIA